MKKFLFLSILFHVLFFSTLVYLWLESDEPVLWSGGYGDGQVEVSYFDLGLLQVQSDGVLEGNDDINQKKNEQNNTEGKTVFENKQELKKTTIKSKNQTRQNTVQKTQKQKIKKGGVIPSFGFGDSDTPAGGTGSGTDSTGVQSKNAPHLLAKIRKKILRNKYYPKQAKQQKLEGSVKVQFKIKETGELIYVKVIQSSGLQILDDAALGSIQKSVPLPYYENPIALTLEYQFLK